jgi:hypothetical protein
MSTEQPPAAPTRRRTSRRTVALAAIAVLVAVGAPTALLLRGDDGAPAMTPRPSPTRPSTSTPSPAAPVDLAAIPRGADPGIAYLRRGVVHEPDGSTVRLPAAATDVTQFTPYHGGWLTLDSNGFVIQLGNDGTVVRRSPQGEARLAVSADQMRTAFQLGGRILVGITTGMGEGETEYPIRSNGRGLAGFVRGGLAYNALPGAVRVIDDRDDETVVSGIYGADATSSGSDLVGGVSVTDGTSGRVVDVRTDRVLWTSAWQPRAFSPDGRYAVGVKGPAPESEATDVAVLDARTGKVIASVSLEDRGLTQLGAPVWEEPGHAVLVGVRTGTGQAELRLTRGGKVTRATDVVPADDTPAWLFATQP